MNVRSWQLALLLCGSIEDSVYDVEGDHAAAHHGAGRNGAPENVSAGKVPNSEERSDDGDNDAGARGPERKFGYDSRIKKASLHS
jgi:hypothetical protein